jgi:hypothetical protein
MKKNKSNPIETRFINRIWDNEINIFILGGNWFTSEGFSTISNYDDSKNRSIGIGFRLCRTTRNLNERG